MKNILKITIVTGILAVFLGCDSKEDCKKEILIPQLYYDGSQFRTYDVLQEVSCDYKLPDEAIEIDPPQLKGFTYEVIYFRFTPDTGNSTSRLEFQIKLNNPNNYAVKGVPVMTTAAEGFEFRGSGYSVDAINPCFGIDANSYCLYSYDKQYPLNLDIGIPDDMELKKVEYFLTN